MVSYSAWIAGVPRPWKRHIEGGRTHPTDQAWRNAVRSGWVAQIGCLNLTGAVHLALRFDGPPALADLDNLIKAVCEALQGDGWPDQLTPAFRNDRQVTSIAAVRTVPGAAGPGVRITVRPLDG